MQRLAGQIWNTYKNNAFAQDATETLIGAGISAGGQALLDSLKVIEGEQPK